MKYLIEDTTLKGIADSIKEKTKSSEPIKVEDFKLEISNIPSGGTSGINTDLTGYTDSLIDIRHFITEIPDMIINTPGTNISNMANAFQHCRLIKTIPNFNTSNIKYMEFMFDSCTDLKSVPNFDTSNVIYMNSMFANCTSLESVPNFDTSKVNNMSNMFYLCTNLKSVPNFNTSKVNDMSSMFQNCISLESVPNFDFSNSVGGPFKNTYSTFSNCTNLKSIGFLNLYKITGAITNMFYNCTNLVDVEGFNFANTTGISQMFYHCNNLSDASIQNIINSVLNCTKVTSTYKSLSVANRNSPFYNTNISNTRYQNRWDELTAAGWKY